MSVQWNWWMFIKPPRNSHGCDSILADLYQALCGHLAPVLANVLTMIGTSGNLPVGFLDGIIFVMYKNRGDCTHAGSYHPIIILCISYRYEGEGHPPVACTSHGD